jgi:hypothetical protein
MTPKLRTYRYYMAHWDGGKCDFPYLMSKSHLRGPLNVQLDTKCGTQANEAI